MAGRQHSSALPSAPSGPSPSSIPSPPPPSSPPPPPLSPSPHLSPTRLPFFPFQPYTSPSQAQPSTLMRPFWTETLQTVCGGALNPPSCPSPLPFPPHQPALLEHPSPPSLPPNPPHMQPNPVLTSHTRLCAAETYGICAEQPILPNNNTSHEYLPFTPFLPLPPSPSLSIVITRPTGHVCCIPADMATVRNADRRASADRRRDGDEGSSRM